MKYSKSFDDIYAYRGRDLGVQCFDKKTTVKIWAPSAEKVLLCIYDEGGAALELPAESEPLDAREKIELTKGERGVWSYEFPENMHGTWYDFWIQYEEKWVRTADPYARACSCNGCRSMMVDLSKTNPEGFLEDKAPKLQTENIIYELHIRDFSIDEKSGIPGEYRGKYKAFTVKQSELSSHMTQTAVNRERQERIPTCLNYLKELGVTHVHLLPFFDFGWLDETQEDSFNWGYDPLNYNVPEGSFATDAKDGTVRIKECKEMIQALHEAGIRVVMDVVYNHTHEADSWLERTAPGYYNRRDAKGKLTNGSACGNDLAVGRAMVDEYILNSVLYWAEEYHLDGFRFDLMGLLTTELMNRIREALDDKYGIGEKLLYGEPWRASDSCMEEGTHAALKDNISYLHPDIAVFSDDTRDVIKGDVFIAEVPGFVNGENHLEERVLGAVKGWREGNENFCPKSCNQVIHYVSAHDNFTLWDKLIYTVKGAAAPEKDEDFLFPDESLIAINKLTALMYFTFQGHLFLQAGEEFGRTKFGDENSFRSPTRVNMLRWEQPQRFADLVSYYQGLIALRKQLPGLYDKSEDAYKRITKQEIHGEGVVSFFVENLEKKDEPYRKTEMIWDKLLIIYNASKEPFCQKLAEGDWEILADDKEANCRKSGHQDVCVPGCSGMILGKKVNV